MVMRQAIQKHVPVALLATSLVNLGIRSLKASLKKIGIDSELYFLKVRSVKYTRSEIEQIIGALVQLDPLLIGISTIELSAVRTKQLIKEIKTTPALKNKILVVGGKHPTICPQEYINTVDIVLRGEGEEAFVELVENLRDGRDYSHIRNLWVRKGGKIFKNEIRPVIDDLNTLPLPDYFLGINLLKNGKLLVLRNEAFDESYPQLKKKAIFLMGARGCMKRCSFCINSNEFSQGKLRKIAVRKIIEYLEDLKRNFRDLGFIYFIEEDFFYRTKDEIYEFINNYYNKINLPFSINCSPDTVTDEKLSALVNGGLKILYMGIQSGSERINRSIYNRHISNDKILKTVRTISNYIERIEVVHDFIINNPYEDKEDILATIELIKKIPPPFILHVHYLKFFKGSSLYEKACKDGIIDKNYSETQLDFHKPRYYLKNGNIYFNLLIALMNGRCTKNRYGWLPSRLVQILTS